MHGISHDLRAPLRAIDGFAARLSRQLGTDADAAALETLARISATSMRMGQLMDGMLELARAGRIELRPMPVDVSMLADWCAAELQDADPGREAVIEVQQGLEVIGDERLLKTLLAQLMRNAWRFSATRPRVQIDVSGMPKRCWNRSSACTAATTARATASAWPSPTRSCRGMAAISARNRCPAKARPSMSGC